MSVHKLQDGRWICKYRDESGKQRREYFGRGPEAERQAIARNASLGKPLGKEPSGPTLQEIAMQYMHARSTTMATKTMWNVGNKFDKVIFPALGHLEVKKITPDILDQYVRDRIKGGVKLTTIRWDLAMIRAAIRWGVERRLLAHDPMYGYRLPRSDNAVLAPPTHAEVAAIYEVAAPHVRRAIILGMYTGLRVGISEMLSLRWESVSLVDRTIFVTSAKKGGMASRVVPIASPLLTLMQEWLAEDRTAGRVEWVVHYKGKQLGQLREAWRTALKRAGITRRIRPYDLRHKAASDMLEAGADLKSVSEILGHASVDMTLRTYQHTSTAMRRDAINRLGNELPGVSKKD